MTQTPEIPRLSYDEMSEILKYEFECPKCIPKTCWERPRPTSYQDLRCFRCLGIMIAECIECDTRFPLTHEEMRLHEETTIHTSASDLRTAISDGSPFELSDDSGSF